MPLATVTQCLTHGGPNYGRAGGDGDEVIRGWIGRATCKAAAATRPRKGSPPRQAHGTGKDARTAGLRKAGRGAGRDRGGLRAGDGTCSAGPGGVSSGAWRQVTVHPGGRPAHGEAQWRAVCGGGREGERPAGGAAARVAGQRRARWRLRDPRPGQCLEGTREEAAAVARRPRVRLSSGDGALSMLASDGTDPAVSVHGGRASWGRRCAGQQAGPPDQRPCAALRALQSSRGRASANRAVGFRGPCRTRTPRYLSFFPRASCFCFSLPTSSLTVLKSSSSSTSRFCVSKE